jgi:predicted permease
VVVIGFGLATGLAVIRQTSAVALGNAEHGVVHRNPIRAAFSIAQISASLALLVITLMLVKTVVGLARAQLGFEPRSVYSYLISPYQEGYSVEAKERLERTVLNALQGEAGVRAVAVSSAAPLSGRESSGGVAMPGERSQVVEAAALEVSPDFFDVLGVQLVAGRRFGSIDVQFAVGESANSVILSEESARRVFGSTNPIGRVVACCEYATSLRTVVGVVRDIRIREIRGDRRPSMYLPLGARLGESPEFAILVKSALGSRRTDSLVAHAVRNADPLLPIASSSSLAETVREQFEEERTLLLVIGLLAATAAFLAAFGLYAVLSYTVTRRTREIAIRMALGSAPADIARMLAHALVRLASVGVVLGLGGAAVLTGALKTRLYDVERFDPVSYGGATLVIIVLVVAAAALPAIRATTIDPASALRTE